MGQAKMGVFKMDILEMCRSTSKRDEILGEKRCMLLYNAFAWIIFVAWNATGTELLGKNHD